MTRLKYILIYLVSPLLVAGIVFAAQLLNADTLPPQPIAFSHRLHLQRAQGITCVDCHQFVTSQTYAGLPSKHLCLDCHDPEVDNSGEQSPEMSRMAQFAVSDDDIPWRRVTTMRQDVFFSHRMHVTVAGLDCRECHPTVADSTTAPRNGPVQMHMETCIGCHRERGASEDCIHCHR